MIGQGPNYEVHVASQDALDVREFSVHQAMSSLFEVIITAVSRNNDIDLEAIIGREASLKIHGKSANGQPKTWVGICNELHQMSVDDQGLATYHFTIVPTLWLSTQRRNYRINQNKSELDIVEKMLGEWAITYEKKITGQYKTRKYRVQYGETDFVFMSRMLEDAGISFYFEDKDGETVMILSDGPQTNEARQAIAFRDQPTAADKEHVTAARISRKVRPGKYTMKDYDYRRPADYPLQATGAGETGSVEDQLEAFHFTPGAFLFESDTGDPTPHADDKSKHRTDETEAAKLAGKRLAAKRGDAITAGLQTNVIDLGPGVVTSLLDHPHRDLGDGKKLLVVLSTLQGRHDEELSHYCEVRSADQPYHPPMNTDKPKVQGCESATIVGPPGEEIHTDEFGRVRVSFHWDRESKMDDNSSCWIHSSQPWGGSGFGGMNLPRVGQEVIVDFLGGDPDRPVITGRIFTNLQKVPYKLPANKTQSGWKSNSTDNTGGFNELMFEDKAGGELLRMRAEKDMLQRVNHDKDTSVGNHRTDAIAGNDKETVNGNQQHMVDGMKSSIVGKDEMAQILGSLVSLTGADRVLKTVGNSVSKALTHAISSDVVTSISVGQSSITIGPDSIIIQSPKVLLNPGDAAAANASLGGSE